MKPVQFQLKADDVIVWTGGNRPTQEQIDAAEKKASSDGWNGTVLDLYFGNHFIREVFPNFN